MAKILEIKDLNIGFDNVPAIEGLNLSLEEGESLAIIGPNGAGKTVLLHALLGMVRYRGTISWAAGTRLGYVPQKIDADRHLPINVQNLLNAKASILKLSKGEMDEVIDVLNLSHKILSTPLGHLSGGQFQRALIGFALLGKPNLLILDEPTASIDIAGEERVYELIHDLQERYGMTVILVSHDLSFVYRYATKVFCMNRIGLCFGAPDEALTPEILEKLYGPHRYFHHFYHLHGKRFHRDD